MKTQIKTFKETTISNHFCRNTHFSTVHSHACYGLKIYFFQNVVNGTFFLFHSLNTSLSSSLVVTHIGLYTLESSSPPLVRKTRCLKLVVLFIKFVFFKDMSINYIRNVAVTYTKIQVLAMKEQVASATMCRNYCTCQLVSLTQPYV